jgi:MFS transporter, ACS family, hexuronate transporter
MLKKHWVPTVTVVGSLLITGTLVNYLSRQAFSLMAPEVSRSVHLSTQQVARLVQSFLLFYTTLPLVWGYLADRFGIRKVYGIVALCWSVLQLGYVFAHSFHQFLLLQALLGATESVNFVACAKAIAIWCSPAQRAKVSGFVQAAAVTGAVITPPLSAFALNWGGWRTIFLWNAVLAFFWVVLWFSLYREKRPDRTMNIASPLAKRGGSEVRSLTVVAGALIAVRLISDPVWWFYLLWLPTYLVQNHIATTVRVGKSLWVPYVAAAVGALVAGAVSDRLIRNTGETIPSRLKTMLVCVLPMPLGFLLLYVHSLGSIMAVLCVVLAGHMGWKTNLSALTPDCFPKTIVGRVESVFSVASGLSGVLFFAYVGRAVGNISYNPIFIGLSLMHPCAYLLLWLTMRIQMKPAASALKVSPANS